MSAEPLVETKQHGPSVEAGPMDEPNPGEHATQVQPSELLAQADVLLDDLGDAQRQVNETLSRPGPSRVHPVASFGRRPSQDVRVRRGPARHVKTPAQLRGSASPTAAPVAPRAPVNRPAGNGVKRIRKRFGNSFPVDDWPLMRLILEQCDNPDKHRFKTCKRKDCDPCQATPCTQATIEKCRACKKKWINSGSDRSRQTCTKREGCPRWWLPRCQGCRW